MYHNDDQKEEQRRRFLLQNQCSPMSWFTKNNVNLVSARDTRDNRIERCQGFV